MNDQFTGIAIILMAILLTLSYGNEAVFDLNLQWHTVFGIIGIVGVLMTLIPSNKYKCK